MPSSDKAVVLDTQSHLASLFPLVASGKVRDLYDIGQSKLLFVATDRISAFDENLENGIPDKGKLLTLLTAHWFRFLSQELPSLRTHFVSLDLPSEMEQNAQLATLFRSRSMVVRRLQVLPIESIVRGYITGSAWSEYKKAGTVHGLPMPEGLRESEKLTDPLWTPSTKAPAGEKDENISPEAAAELIGSKYAREVEKLSLQIYETARDYAAERGIIIADTKFEFAVDRSNDQIVLVDEVLTPDSSRFWPADRYQVGRSQPSLDKQVLRDWLVSNGFKGQKAVTMPDEVVQRTADGYREAFEKITEQSWKVVSSS